ncbi:MAG: hypothetical protein F9K32_10155 [Desulfobulbaceae bacterium]|nr:MAG: hypothetical protein F9K32_10155 [Desulfobulbaceae bacterium]
MRRYLILILTVIWGCIVFLPGSALLAQALLRTSIAILPMLIALLLIGDRDVRWRRGLRRFYGTAMPLFILVVKTGSLLSIPYVLTGILLVWPEIVAARRRTKFMAIGFVCLLLGVLAGINSWRWHHMPLPADQELIGHFERNRPIFERLVQEYRNCRIRGKFFYQTSPEVLEMMKKVGVDDIGQASGPFGSWYPKPYSRETLEVLKFIQIRSVEDVLTGEEKMKVLKQRLPSLFEGVAPLKDMMDVAQVTTPVRFDLGPDPSKPEWGKITVRYPDSFLKKGFCYYPQLPRLEDGHVVATGYSLKDKSYTRPGIRVFEFLDEYPPDLQRYECVVKPIDPQWFIYLCRYAP